MHRIAGFTGFPVISLLSAKTFKPCACRFLVATVIVFYFSIHNIAKMFFSEQGQGIIFIFYYFFNFSRLRPIHCSFHLQRK